MNIYFAGAIRGGHMDIELYHQIILYLQKTDNVLTKHVGDLNMHENATDKEIFIRDTVWLQNADILIAECSSPSLGVGYELAYAERHNIPVHIFYRVGINLSAMLTGNPYFNIHPYVDEAEIYRELDKILGR